MTDDVTCNFDDHALQKVKVFLRVIFLIFYMYCGFLKLQHV